MIAYYESRAVKAPAALLLQMAAALDASTDELLGIKPIKKGKKPDTQLHRRLQRIEKLDPKAKRQITPNFRLLSYFTKFSTLYFKKKAAWP